MNKWYCIKLRSFCIVKETTDEDPICRMDKISVNNSANKRLISRTYKQLKQPYSKITNHLTLAGGKTQIMIAKMGK
jgi:hypothetical protein